jgi:hypothetical protein
MKLLLSGEGKTDIGHRVIHKEGWKFQPGPMAKIVDQLLNEHPRIGYSLLSIHASGGDCIHFVDETELAQRAKSGPMKLPGIKYGKGTGLFTRNAQVLGLLAKEERERSNLPVVAVLFRDTDGTRSAPAKEWQEKFDSMIRGFKLAGFEAGVPMIPRPKSEAWLLCALKTTPANDCHNLENAPGNDGSPNSLKNQLTTLIGHEPSAEEQVEWFESGRIDSSGIRMPSFNEFYTVLQTAVANALGFNEWVVLNDE